MFSIINLNDPQIWVALSFLLFFVIFGSLIWKKFSNFLDKKINDISQEILVASNLHQEAKNLLSEEKKSVSCPARLLIPLAIPTSTISGNWCFSRISLA